MLLERHDVPVGDAVRRIVALQAQEPASPYLALWSRIRAFNPGDLDLAFREHVVVKATLMRITLHAVHVDDYPTFHEAMRETLRAARLNDRRFLQSGLTPEEAEVAAPLLVEFASESRTRDEMEATLADHMGTPDVSWVWWALRHVGHFWHAPSDDSWSFGRRPSYVAARTERHHDPRLSAQRLIRRYLQGFGPASPRDFAQFALLRQSTIRPALKEMTDLVEREGPDGELLLDVANAPLPDEETPAPPRLMAMWDSTLLAYRDRGRVVPEEFRRVVIQRNGDVLPTVLVDGYVSGVWRPVEGGVEVTSFRPLSDAVWEQLTCEARDLLDLLADREPTVYSRYGRWWSDLPAAQSSVLSG